MKDIFRIDPERLDQEWLEQAQLYYQAASRLADANEELERAKAHRDVVEAQKDLDVRRSPQEFQLPEKLTEKMVANVVLLSKEYRKAHDRVIVAQHEAAVHKAEVDALGHRKSALEDLVRLRLANYFSEPRVGGENSEGFRNKVAANSFKAKKGAKAK